jgi:hypothetical protein
LFHFFNWANFSFILNAERISLAKCLAINLYKNAKITPPIWNPVHGFSHASAK